MLREFRNKNTCKHGTHARKQTSRGSFTVSPSCPSSTCVQAPLLPSQTRAVESCDAVMRSMLLPMNSTLTTLHSWGRGGRGGGHITVGGLLQRLHCLQKIHVTLPLSLLLLLVL